MNYLSKSSQYVVQNGSKSFINKVRRKIIYKKAESHYNKWIFKHIPDEQELELQRKIKFTKQPLISILVPTYNTVDKFLKEMIDSVIDQTYPYWELCIADGSNNENVKNVVTEYQTAAKNRIKYKFLNKNEGISNNTNEAMKLATGEFIAILDHDDLITPNALFEIVKCLNEEKDIDIIYSDEDKVSFDLKKYFQPHFKPDFNIDLFRSVNYINHLFVVKAEILNKVGKFRSEFDGAQDYDLIFRCIEVSKKIYHIPKVLYHWRSHSSSTAENPESKIYAFEAGIRAIESHYNRVSIKAKVEHGPLYGLYHTIYELDNNPLVSIIIVSQDNVYGLNNCISSIVNKSRYKNIEFIIIEFNSKETKTFKAYEQLKKDHYNVNVVTWEDEFNYSLINNYGVSFAKGEYILFLNSDTEIINEDCFEEMLGYCMRDDVGVVGARLFYKNDTVQHAGVIVGFGGSAGHAFQGQGRYDYGYFARAMCVQDYSAVTAACMMTKKSIFDSVGGFSGEFKIVFNDIDYCLRVRELGKLVVYNSYAQLYHYEPKSKDVRDIPEKQERFNKEREIFRTRWSDILEKGDPYYNINLTLNKFDFSLRCGNIKRL